jgi:methionyl aminopeptidase
MVYNLAFVTPTRKTTAQIAKMRESGLIAWKPQQAAAAAIKVGVTTAEIDAEVEKVISAHNAQPLFKGHRGSATSPFPAATCISINHEVVHGIPGSRKLNEGDIVSIDIGVRLDGWCSDTAMTLPVGEVDFRTKKLL